MANKKKHKIKKPRDWSIVHLINRGGSGQHNNKTNRSKEKLNLKLNYNKEY